MMLQSQDVRRLLRAVEQRGRRKPELSKKESALVVFFMWAFLFIAALLVASAQHN